MAASIIIKPAWSVKKVLQPANYTDTSIDEKKERMSMTSERERERERERWEGRESERERKREHLKEKQHTQQNTISEW